MSELFAPDGCAAPNIATQDYQLTFAAKCEHSKVRSAEIVISAPSEADARRYAATWLQQGVMKNTVLTGVEAVREHECPEGTWHVRNGDDIYAVHPDSSTHRI